jgi:hypothetical protein
MGNAGVRESSSTVVAAHTEEGGGPQVGAYDNTQSKTRLLIGPRPSATVGFDAHRLSENICTGPKKLALSVCCSKAAARKLPGRDAAADLSQRILSPRVAGFEGARRDATTLPADKANTAGSNPALQDNNMFEIGPSQYVW